MSYPCEFQCGSFRCQNKTTLRSDLCNICKRFLDSYDYRKFRTKFCLINRNYTAGGFICSNKVSTHNGKYCDQHLNTRTAEIPVYGLKRKHNDYSHESKRQKQQKPHVGAPPTSQSITIDTTKILSTSYANYSQHQPTPAHVEPGEIITSVQPTTSTQPTTQPTTQPSTQPTLAQPTILTSTQTTPPDENLVKAMALLNTLTPDISIRSETPTEDFIISKIMECQNEIKKYNTLTMKLKTERLQHVSSASKIRTHLYKLYDKKEKLLTTST